MHQTELPYPASCMSAAPRVAILVGTHNGDAHLEDQLRSYVHQTLRPSWVIAGDDGSTDDTVTQFKAFGDAAPEGIDWQLIPGPRKGSCANYMSLLAQPGPETDYVALSDQDDIWLPNKLERAIALLQPHADQPALLGTRSWEWHSESDTRVKSRPVQPPYEFRHALVQNFAGGNTMVLNRKAIDLVQVCLTDMPTPAVHDWWLYQLISGAGGVVLLDEDPHLLYRQHKSNQIGANSSWRSKIRRTQAMMSGTYRSWNSANCAALHACRAHLTADSQRVLEQFLTQRHSALPARLRMLSKTGLYRKGRANQAMLWVTALINKL